MDADRRIPVGFRGLLPDAVRIVETIDLLAPAPLLGSEAIFVANAVEARRNEFAAGRALAHAALARLGSPAETIGVGPDREPIWPVEVVGSITHCDGYAAAAVATTIDARSVGIDAEPFLPLPDEVIELVASARELDRLAATSGLAEVGARLLFSAKESIYKAWFPLTGRWLGFEDCDLTITPDDETTGSFTGVIAAGSLTDVSDVELFEGRYHLDALHILTAVFVPIAE